MPIVRWEGNPHGIPEFEPVFSYSQPEPEPVVQIEVQRPNFSREQIFADIRGILSEITDLKFYTSIKTVGSQSESRINTENTKTPIQALRFSLDSIDERCLSLMAPMRESFLKNAFPYHSKYSSLPEKVTASSEEEILKPSIHSEWPKIDSGIDRVERYEILRSVLNAMEYTTIEEMDTMLDLCDQQRERRGWNSYAIYKIYAKTLGSWREQVEFARPWHDEIEMNRLFPTLSAEAESDITPIPEINEND